MQTVRYQQDLEILDRIKFVCPVSFPCYITLSLSTLGALLNSFKSCTYPDCMKSNSLRLCQTLSLLYMVQPPYCRRCLYRRPRLHMIVYFVYFDSLLYTLPLLFSVSLSSPCVYPSLYSDFLSLYLGSAHKMLYGRFWSLLVFELGSFVYACSPRPISEISLCDSERCI